MRQLLSKLGLPLGIAAALLFTGCIISGQFVIVLPIKDDIESRHDAVGSVPIDLDEMSETWEDHSDEIQGVVDLKFECRIINHLETAATGEVYISPKSLGVNPSAGDITGSADAVLFLSGIVVPGGGSPVDISFTESSKYITNLPAILKIIETGKFYIYGIAAGTPFHITVGAVSGQEKARILVTFSAG